MKPESRAVRIECDVVRRMKIFCTLHRVDYSRFLTDCMNKCGIPTLEEAERAAQYMDYEAARRINLMEDSQPSGAQTAAAEQPQEYKKEE